MPELPEVETIRRGLEKQIVSKKISKIIIKKPNLVKQSQASFRRELIGGTFTSVDRIGKLLIFTILPEAKSSRIVADYTRTNAEKTRTKADTQTNAEDSKFLNSQIPKFIIIHLKMTGQLVYCDENNFIAGGHANSKKEEEEFLNGDSKIFCKPGRFTHIIFELENQQGGLSAGQHRGLSADEAGKTSMLSSVLFFNDLRQFGSLKVVNQEELKKIKSTYGIEPGRPNFTLANFKKALKNRKGKIKAVLLNQSIISGLGNIYVDESLFAAKIHPRRPANRITANEQKRLFNAIQRIIKLAIKNNGTTFSDFLDSKGKKGNFSQKLKVYGRAGEKCTRKNCTDVIQKIKVAGRGTSFCGNCQK